MADEGGVTSQHAQHVPEGRIDLRDVKRLLHLMDLHGLAELELEDEGRRVRLRKGGGVDGQGFFPVPAHVVAPLQAPGTIPPAAAPAAPPPAASRGAEVRSPMVGTFYRAASPEAGPFIEVGDSVGKETVVCIIEAMKVMNEIKAEVEGVVVAVLAQNGDAVEFDQPLFLVKPAGAAA